MQWYNTTAATPVQAYFIIKSNRYYYYLMNNSIQNNYERDLQNIPVFRQVNLLYVHQYFKFS